MLSDDEISEQFDKVLAEQIAKGGGLIEAVTDMVRFAERAAYERAAQECIETAAELRRCADGCTDGRYDWKADGADDCADAIRAAAEIGRRG